MSDEQKIAEATLNKPLVMEAEEKLTLNSLLLERQRLLAEILIEEDRIKRTVSAPPLAELNVADGSFYVEMRGEISKLSIDPVSAEDMLHIQDLYRDRRLNDAHISQLETKIKIRCGAPAYAKYDERFQWVMK